MTPNGKYHTTTTDNQSRIHLPNKYITTSFLDATSTSKSATAASFATSTVFSVTASAEGRTASSELVFLAIASFGTGGTLLVGGGNNFIGKSQVRSQVGNAGIGQVAIVVLPAESDTDVFTGFQRLHQHEDLQVGGSLDLGMGWRLGVLLDDANAFLEEVAEDSDTVLFGDEHGCCGGSMCTCLSYFRAANTKTVALK